MEPESNDQLCEKLKQKVTDFFREAEGQLSQTVLNQNQI